MSKETTQYRSPLQASLQVVHGSAPFGQNDSGNGRASLATVASEPAVTSTSRSEPAATSRTYTTKHGTVTRTGHV